MMKRDPYDPDGEYERKDYKLNEQQDEFCAREGYQPIERGQVASILKPPQTTITDEVISVIRQREVIGMGTYGRPLLAGDGRDTLQDAIEEAADLLQYLVKMKAERDE